nr:MAG TPA: hypothetical protein [Caudoviricetes sp.]
MLWQGKEILRKQIYILGLFTNLMEAISRYVTYEGLFTFVIMLCAVITLVKKMK